MNTQEQLDALAQEIIDTKLCPELGAQATQLVMGDGRPDADIVFIGEAPGKKEDLDGVPFVGASGKFLNAMLEAAGMSRSDVYITNIVKYRPPGNRDPLPAEKAAFLPYLLRQLDIIAPKVVVTLGRHSMEYFLPGAKIGEVHGQLHQVRIDDHEYTV
ncbi:uracil-DNA glycosylase, partial [Candidatus Saccharibacteria bacterium]|nr:uracil-DNA glycosylase [Candidatus Saccharibacteria bacterium]